MKIHSLLLAIILIGVLLSPVYAGELPDNVSTLIAGLNSNNHTERLDAIRTLGKTGDNRAIPALAALLTKEFDNAEERDETFLVLAYELRNFDSDEALDALNKIKNAQFLVLIDVPDPEERGTVKKPKYNWLTAVEISTWKILATRARKEIKKIRKEAVNDAKAAEKVSHLAWEGNGANRQFRDVAAEELENMGDIAVKVAIDALDNAGGQCQLDIIRFLKKMYVEKGIKDDAITKAMISQLESESEEIRVEAIKTLQKMEDPSSEKALIEIANKYKGHNLTGNWALRAFGPWASDEAIKVIIEHLGTNNGDSIYIYLKNFGDRVIPYAENPLFSNNRLARIEMVFTLCEIASEKSKELLDKYLKKYPEDKNWVMERYNKNRKSTDK
jgi:HEAT repeat protein